MIRWNCLAMSMSMPIPPTWPRNSTAVTWVPSLDTDNSSADQNHLLRNFFKTESSGGGDNGLLIHCDAREGSDLAASGDHDVLGVHHLSHVAIGANDGHLVGSRDLSVSLQVGDLVALEQHLDAASQSRHSLRPLAHQVGQVELDVTNLDTSLGKVA